MLHHLVRITKAAKNLGVEPLAASELLLEGFACSERGEWRGPLEASQLATLLGDRLPVLGENAATQRPLETTQRQLHRSREILLAVFPGSHGPVRDAELLAETLLTAADAPPPSPQVVARCDRYFQRGHGRRIEFSY
jgi:hypothetical protein